MNIVRSFKENKLGTDYVVGDIHGFYSRLQAKLDSIGFNPSVDRLFMVGDLVDRGPESYYVTDWLRKPFVHSIRGNHEEMCTWFIRGHLEAVELNKHGGQWLSEKIDPKDHWKVLDAFNRLPYLIEVNTPHGKVGIVHASITGNSWEDFKERLDVERYALVSGARDAACWSDTRIKDNDASPIADIRALVVGHYTLPQPKILGNTYYIDTNLSHSGCFTLLNLRTLNFV